MLEFCVFGAGRIAKIHAANIARHPKCKLRYVVDIHQGAAEALAAEHGAKALTDPGQALGDPKVNAVLIASPTDTHVDLTVAAARAGKAIFCEKPIDLSLGRVDACLEELSSTGAVFFVGFNRRFDPSFRAVEQRVRQGELGQVELVVISSRDPSPPPVSYIKVSGGLFRDMMIHDFDMARWLLGEEPVEVFAQASCRVDPAIGEAGDVDTAMVQLRTKSGALCHINNSRRAVYGYDQRIEVFGARGMLQAGNLMPTSVSAWGKEGVRQDPPLNFFLERYAEAYRHELESFVSAIDKGESPRPGAKDARQALVLADAAVESLKANRPVPVTF